MKVDKEKALNDAQNISEDLIRKAADNQELIDSSTDTIMALVEAGHSEEIIIETIQKQVGNRLPTGYIRNVVKDVRATKNPPLPPGESQPIGEGNPNPWEEWGDSKGKDAD